MAHGNAPPFSVVRYCIFLLVTTVHKSPRIEPEISVLQNKDSMTHQPSGVIVAVDDDDQRILQLLEYLHAIKATR